MNSRKFLRRKKNYFRKQGYQKALIHVTGKYLVFHGLFDFGFSVVFVLEGD